MHVLPSCHNPTTTRAISYHYHNHRTPYLPLLVVALPSHLLTPFPLFSSPQVTGHCRPSCFVKSRRITIIIMVPQPQTVTPATPTTPGSARDLGDGASPPNPGGSVASSPTPSATRDGVSGASSPSTSLPAAAPAHQVGGGAD